MHDAEPGRGEILIRAEAVGMSLPALGHDNPGGEVAAMCTLIPDGVDDAVAIVVVRSGQVALGAARAASVTKGESVLVTAAAGAVGHMAVQLARALGAAQVIGAVGSPGKADFVRDMGADTVVTYDTDWGEPVDVVLDGVGGHVLQKGVEALAPFGRLVSFSAVSAHTSTRTNCVRG
jgi:NADPH:quinone reductase-like Zn-dependent oxidoreductase